MREEIKETTEHVISEEIEEYTVVEKKYYVVKNLIVNATYNRILIIDYDNLTESQSTINLYDSTNSLVPYPMYLSGEAIAIYQNGSWITCSLEKHKSLKNKTTIKKPIRRLVEAWDKVTTEITESIQKEIDTVQNFMQKDLKNLKTNIFVDPALSVHIESNLNSSREHIESYKIDVAKIKDQYGNIE